MIAVQNPVSREVLVDLLATASFDRGVTLAIPEYDPEPSVGVDGESGPVSMARYECGSFHLAARACYSVYQHPW